MKDFFLSHFTLNTPEYTDDKLHYSFGAIHRVLQLSCVLYFIIQIMILDRGYDETSGIESSAITKVKGVVFTNFSKNEFDPLINQIEEYHRIWDIADYVIPPTENNAFFVMTNVVITSNQEQKACPEDPDISTCVTDADCSEGTAVHKGNGVNTGRCVHSDRNPEQMVCEILGWCPVERDVNPLKDGTALLSLSKNFTVLLKNFVQFPEYNETRRNVPDHDDNIDKTHDCLYDPIYNRHCPIFRLGDIVEGDYDSIAKKGGAMAIIIDWDCNFDYPSECLPKYTFHRLDNASSIVGRGSNFRYAHYYGFGKRDLYKAYGIKFIIILKGQGHKFSLIGCFVHFATGISYMVTPTIVFEIVIWLIACFRSCNCFCRENNEIQVAADPNNVPNRANMQDQQV